MPLVDVNDTQLYYEIHGAGPNVLNLPGSGGDLRGSRPERNPLNEHFTVLHFDQRGQGRAGRPPGPYTMATFADDAAALMTAVGWDTAQLVGTSFGGMVGLEMALRHPERIERLVVNCASPGGPMPSFPIEQLETMDVEAALEMKLGLVDNRWDPGADEPIPDYGSAYDKLIENYRKPRAPEDQEFFLLQLEARAQHDVYYRMGKIDIPTLVCAGEYDDQAPLANSIAMVEGIPRAELRVFQGGHYFLRQDRTAYPAIIEWLAAT